MKNLFKKPQNSYRRYSVMQEDGKEIGVEWLVTFHLPEDEFDDSFDKDSIEEVIIVAEDFDTAYKYAQQYIRTMQLKDDVKHLWNDAEILSIDRA